MKIANNKNIRIISFLSNFLDKRIDAIYEINRVIEKYNHPKNEFNTKRPIKKQFIKNITIFD